MLITVNLFTVFLSDQAMFWGVYCWLAADYLYTGRSDSAYTAFIGLSCVEASGRCLGVSYLCRDPFGSFRTSAGFVLTAVRTLLASRARTSL